MKAKASASNSILRQITEALKAGKVKISCAGIKPGLKPQIYESSQEQMAISFASKAARQGASITVTAL